MPNLLPHVSAATAASEIPVFFSTDDRYLPFLDIAVASLIDHASKDYRYRLIILHTGLSAERMEKLLRRRSEGFFIEFVDISTEVENIRAAFKDVYHFSVVTYYRLFIASLFPQYDKIIYLDCDLIVLGDISEMYRMEMGDNILGAVRDQYVAITDEFKLYARDAVDVDPEGYINAGVLLMNLCAFRENRIEEKFVELITNYDFDVVDPDQAYLNYLCAGKILYLKNGWNKVPMPTPCEGKKNIVHYALYKKPWQYDDLIDGEHFWGYAKKSPFYQLIAERSAAFSPEDRVKSEAVAGDIVKRALEIIDSDENFKKRLKREVV